MTKPKKASKKIMGRASPRSVKGRAVKATPAPATPIVAYKGFDKSLRCRGFQYEIGKTYTHTGPVVRCAAGGFHACESPSDVLKYYRLTDGSRICEVEAGGKIDRAPKEDTKFACGEITIKAELTYPQFIKRAVDWVLAHAKTKVATGDSGHAAATGNYGHAAATGNSGHAAATGDYGHAAATGDSGHAAATGDYGHAAATGDYGHAAATGNSGHAAATGKNAIAAALGIGGKATAEKGGAIMLAEYDANHNLLAVFASKVGKNGVKAGKTYRLCDGKPVEV